MASPRPTAPTRFAGLDENGLGPRLGPLLVTACALETRLPEEALAAVARRARIEDSKARCAHGAMASVEAQVLALLDVHRGLRPGTFDALLAALHHPSAEDLRAPCPAGEAPRQCFSAPLALPAFGPGPAETDREAARSLQREGVAWVYARASVVCAGRLNAARARGQSRFDVDLSRMLDLVAEASRACGALDVTCGRVGGRADYLPALTGRFALAQELERSPRCSRYRVPGVGAVAWRVDADATHPAVALASMVGKYLRELWMERQHRYYALAVDGLGRASGYHDPVTARWVEATRLVRAQRGIDGACFER
ncbi:MAG: hypothetical protein HY909_24150 [Deltaproteobacteria bacterium]|nr:hypothetical protein [Deltaproteobacteria bacterium]